MTTTAPLKEMVFKVSLPRNEGTQKLDELEKRLKDKAADRVTEWVRQNVPTGSGSAGLSHRNSLRPREPFHIRWNP